MKSCFPLLFTLVVCSIAAPQAHTADPAFGRQPNIILIITDDQGYGDVGAHGNTMIQTPNLDQLYAESVRLTNFHVDPRWAQGVGSRSARGGAC